MPKGENSKDTQFHKGKSGNPGGRPKQGLSMTEILREVGNLKDVTHEGELIERKTALAHKMWQLALKGREQVMRYMYDRIDGKPTQEIKVQSNVEVDAPIFITIAGAKIEPDTEGSE